MSANPGHELLAAVAELRALFPDWRLGRLVANPALTAGRDDASGVWDAEDERMLAAATRLIKRNQVGRVETVRP